jgi:hypothetical protein
VVAELFLTRALTVYARVLPRNHSILAQGLDSYAALLRKMRRDEEAEKVETRAKQIRAELTNMRDGGPQGN